MSLDEWTRMNLPMRWSIYKGECDLSVPIGLSELDLKAGVPDGTYDVVSADAEFAEEGRIGGVVVRNGEFDPKTTAEACYRAICVGCYGMGPREIAESPPIDHCFIERLYYDAKVSAFVLVTGS
ncbi:MAG: hypothetical protein OXG35_30940 [Acidobacteria bacterium]|nr:hypothetical protein [Acidobacteriota bacterium]